MKLRTLKTIVFFLVVGFVQFGCASQRSEFEEKAAAARGRNIPVSQILPQQSAASSAASSASSTPALLAPTTEESRRLLEKFCRVMNSTMTELDGLIETAEKNEQKEQEEKVKAERDVERKRRRAEERKRCKEKEQRKRDQELKTLVAEGSALRSTAPTQPKVENMKASSLLGSLARKKVAVSSHNENVRFFTTMKMSGLGCTS